MVNSFNFKSLKKEELKKFEQFMNRYSNIIPIGKFVYFYILSKKAKNFYIDNENVFRYERLGLE